MRRLGWIAWLPASGGGPKVDSVDAGADEGAASDDAEETATSASTTTSTSGGVTTSTSTGGSALGCCEIHVAQPGCNNAGIEACVCAIDPSCCDAGWDDACVEQVHALGCGVCPGGTSTTSTSTSTSVGTVSTSTSTTGGHDACVPAPDDDACDACTKASCCEEVAACYANPDCVCLVECVQVIEDVMMCLQDVCMTAPPREVLPLQACASRNCADICPV
jgi:hypothetical protein